MLKSVQWHMYITLSLISSHAYGYIYTVYNTTGRDMWIEVNISGQWQKQYMLNGQSYDFGFKDFWKKGLCLTEIKYKHEKAADDKKNNKDWKLVQFSLAKDLKKAAIVGTTSGAGAIGGAVAGGASGFAGLTAATTVVVGTAAEGAMGSAVLATATAQVVALTVGAAAGAALGIGIAAGALALSALCRNITGSGGIFVYENNKGKVCWTFGKIEKKQ